MTSTPLLFDAVLFDLDGTLVATDRFWVDAARAGSRRAFAELGLEREMPSAREWMSVVGVPLAAGFEALFPDLTREQRRVLLARCIEEERSAVRAGRAALLPGVEETLRELAQRGLYLGIASNCDQTYLDTMMHDLGLSRFVREARCLDSPGVTSKTGMVADLVETFGTRAAVMVGDRLGDRDAAWQNGLPHVHFARGFAVEGEDVIAEAVIQEMVELVPLLSRRTQWIGAALDRLGFRDSAGVATAGNPKSREIPKSLGITGHSGSGKTIFARDVQRLLQARGCTSGIVALDDFLKPDLAPADLASTAFVPAERALDHLEQAFEVDEVLERVIAPHARGEALSFQRGRARIEVPRGAVLILQGLFLLHPRLRPALERVVYLAVSENLSLKRVAGRDARSQGPESLLRVRRHYLPTQRAFDERIDPEKHADLVLDAENALGAEPLPGA